MPRRKKSDKEQIVSLDSFGLAKHYWCFWIKNNLNHFAFSKHLDKIFKCRCAFIGNIELEEKGEILRFPAYFLSFNEEYSVNMAIIANKTFASKALSAKLQNPLFGGLLFEDEYYIYNNRGPFLHLSSFSDADYIFLFSADKSISPDEYITTILDLDNKEYEILKHGEPRAISENEKNSKKFLDFLQYLYYETESSVNDYKSRKLFAKLHNKMSVSEKNYGKLKYPIDDYRVITSEYLRREDF